MLGKPKLSWKRAALHRREEAVAAFRAGKHAEALGLAQELWTKGAARLGSDAHPDLVTESVIALRAQQLLRWAATKIM